MLHATAVAGQRSPYEYIYLTEIFAPTANSRILMKIMFFISDESRLAAILLFRPPHPVCSGSRLSCLSGHTALAVSLPHHRATAMENVCA